MASLAKIHVQAKGMLSGPGRQQWLVQSRQGLDGENTSAVMREEVPGKDF
jgi:hypothetical protein